MGVCSSKVVPYDTSFVVSNQYVRQAIRTGSLRDLRQYVAYGYRVQEPDLVLAVKTYQSYDLIIFLAESNPDAVGDQAMYECVLTNNTAIAKYFLRWYRPHFHIIDEAFNRKRWDLAALLCSQKMSDTNKFSALRAAIVRNVPTYVIDAAWDITIKYQKSLLEEVASSPTKHVWSRILALEPACWFDLMREFVERDNAPGVVYMTTHRSFDPDIGRRMIEHAYVHGSANVVTALEKAGFRPFTNFHELMKQAIRNDHSKGVELMIPKVTHTLDNYLVIACYRAAKQSILVLINAGVDPLCQNGRGLRLCTERLRDDVADLLIEHTPLDQKERALEIRRKFAVTN